MPHHIDMVTRVKAAAERVFPAIVQLRRSIHRHPELAFEEHGTARLVLDALAPLGMPVRTEIARTGLVATLHGLQPGPTVLLRADMDALPVTEETGAAFASVRTGVMHACGHDVHTAALVGAAMVLHQLREFVPGVIRMVFQPGEELLPGGAKPMIDAGVLTGSGGVSAPIAAFAQHVLHTLPAGTIGVRGGMFMASSDELHLRIDGSGGHAAEPHRLAGDPVLAAAHVIVALQNVISRYCPPDVPSVLSIGKVDAPGATNVIPGRVLMQGTFRAMDEGWRREAHGLIRRIVGNTAAAHGAEARTDIRKGYPALHNDPEAAALARRAAVEFAGEAHTADVDLWFASEDFAYFLQAVPGTLFVVGAGTRHALHTSRFLADELALRTGIGFMAYLAWRFLQSHANRS